MDFSPALHLITNDPSAGLLPINDSTGVGAGFVSYTVRPKANRIIRTRK